MIHRQHGVECAAFGPAGTRCLRKRAFGRDPVSNGFFHRGSNRVDFFPPKFPPSPHGVEASDRDARRLNPAVRIEASVSLMARKRVPW